MTDTTTAQPVAHRIEMGIVQAGTYSNPHLECVTPHTGGCAFNEYVAEEGNSDALYGLGWPTHHDGQPIRFPLLVTEERDPARPDTPTWNFHVVPLNVERVGHWILTEEALDDCPVGAIIRSDGYAWIDDTYGSWVAEKVGEDLWALTGLGNLKPNRVLLDAVPGWETIWEPARD